MVHLIEIISANFKSYFTKYCVKKRERVLMGPTDSHTPHNFQQLLKLFLELFP